MDHLMYQGCHFVGPVVDVGLCAFVFLFSFHWRSLSTRFLSSTAMATAGDCESGGAGEDFRKKIFGAEIDEDAPNVSLEPDRNSSSGVSKLNTRQDGNSAGISEIEEMMKQKTFTRSETQHLIALLHSRTIEEPPSSVVEEEIGKLTATCPPKAPMKSPQHTTTMENLPDELLSKIFIRMFAKQLGQMRSVSKSWNALLSQSSFIKSHLHRHIHNNDQILLLFHKYCEYGSDSKPFAAFPSRSPHLELTNSIKCPDHPRPEYRTNFSFIGSVNGLICSSYGDSIIQIWNPSLSSVLTLPPFYKPPHDLWVNNHDSVRTFFRFGFDPKTNDYKVVKRTGHFASLSYDDTLWLQSEIYSMRKGTWDVITERFPSHIHSIDNQDDTCADGRDGPSSLEWCFFEWGDVYRNGSGI